MPTPRRSLLKFRVSAALKDIIGRDLISDDFMAIFELVKNSYDAHATTVDVIFENIGTKEAKIIIKDDGKGMDLDDIKNKWLFVAYSAKTEGTEDSDYREKIYQSRPYAGAKGIGRFSTDRLGKHLKIETRKKGKRVEILNTDWEQFEQSLRDEFIKIDVKHTWKNEADKNFKHGTILEISDLRAEWDRDKMLRLKDSLAKLIAPTSAKDVKQFQINIISEDESFEDEDQDDPRKKVNGPVGNFIFEELGLRTTKIEAIISDSGRGITTKLTDGGTLIYRIKENNQFTLLRGISITIYYLNKSAKLTFAKRMGLASRLYGHIFLYKNGIRIYPFGEPTEDPLKIDERKSRKQFSRLGTSELIGQIEITGDNKDLKETSSRGDGLINNSTYKQLKECFVSVLERVEKYVVEVQEWGLSIEENLDDYSEKRIKQKIADLITELTNSDQIIHFEYSKNFLQILQEAQNNSAMAIVDNLTKIAAKSGNNSLVGETKKIANKLNKLRFAKELAEEKTEAIATELEEKESQNLFLRSIKSQELEDVLNLMHHIGISTSTIQNYIRGVVFRLDKDVKLGNNELKDILAKINIEVSKIYSISRFATKANFKVSVKPSKTDIKGFISEYLGNIVRPFLPNGVRLTVLIDNDTPFFKEIRPLELTILLDNLINNSRKAKASQITVSLHQKGKSQLILKIKDDGTGIEPENRNKIFDYGFTTTNGSGLGLAHVKDILEKLNSSIELAVSTKSQTEFIITFNQF